MTDEAMEMRKSMWQRWPVISTFGNETVTQKRSLIAAMPWQPIMHTLQLLLLHLDRIGFIIIRIIYMYSRNYPSVLCNYVVRITLMYCEYDVDSSPTCSAYRHCYILPSHVCLRDEFEQPLHCPARYRNSSIDQELRSGVGTCLSALSTAS